jgi:hypothetical protein
MIRVALAAYLALTSAVGPWACCCAPGRLASRLFSPAREGAPSCCQHRAAAGHEQQAPSHCPRGRHSPFRPGCPCKEGLAFEAAVLPPSTEDTTGASPRPGGDWRLAPGCLGLGSPPHAGGPAAWPALPGAPFLSTHDLLCVHHVMRC